LQQFTTHRIQRHCWIELTPKVAGLIALVQRSTLTEALTQGWARVVAVLAVVHVVA
jgi:hypothetical protein